jgi:hypothetical protein
MPRPGSRQCGDLLDFEEVRHRLQLGTRTDVGTLEIRVRDVVGSVGRVHEFDGCFRPRTARLRALLGQIKAARPDAADVPILVYQVDHAYFVIDGHKRLALAVEEGREYIDAEVGRYASRFHLAAGTTIDEIRATEMERRFRETTGLAQAVPDVRFPLRDPDAYLELAESVKAHGYDMSRGVGRVVSLTESARHWYDVVYRPAVDLGKGSGIGRVLSSCSDAELFLVLRRGADEEMGPSWEMPPAFAERALGNIRAAAPGRLESALAPVTRRRRRIATVLEPSDLSAGQSASTAGGATEVEQDRATTIIRRPRREVPREPGPDR